MSREKTRPTINSNYLYAEPSDWYAIGDEVAWNDTDVLVNFYDHGSDVSLHLGYHPSQVVLNGVA